MTQGESGRKLIAGRYAVRSLIGRGGSGAVWRGEDVKLQRPVAIKQIVLSDSTRTRTRTRAMREAQAAAKLDAPGLVRVYDVHEDDSEVCLIMELIDAPSLARLVRRHGALAPRRAARIGLSMLHTLEAVHAAGIIHRDVKPSNVLVGDRSVHITDFGIALLADDPTVTASGSVLGTPTYMAPEQARGERVGPAADLYGLAATLYFAVEGRPPFDDVGSIETTRAVRERPHRPASHLGPLTSPVEALLRKDPRERPAADAVAAALTVAADGGRPAPPAARTSHDPVPDADAVDHPVPADHTSQDHAAEPRAELCPAGDVADGSLSDEAADGPAADGDGGSTREDAQPDDGSHGRRPRAGRDRLRSLGIGDSGQQRRTALVVAGLLVLLALALMLLFLAVRENPVGATTAAAAVGTRPTMDSSISGGAPMEQVNAMRAVLVAGALVAALICAAFGIWSAAAILLVGVGAHGLLWRHLGRATPPPDNSG